jgi:hypothetical protein
MNLKIIYKHQYERDAKLKKGEEDSESSDDDDPQTRRRLSNLSLAATLKRSKSKHEIQSMKDYIKNFCKQHEIHLKFDKFPISMFMDQPMNAAFINYKKRKLFHEVVSTVENIVKEIQEEKEAEDKKKALETIQVDPREEYQKMMHLKRNAKKSRVSILSNLESSESSKDGTVHKVVVGDGKVTFRITGSNFSSSHTVSKTDAIHEVVK